MPDGNQPTGILLGVVSKLSWWGKNKLRDIESEFSAGYPEKVFWFYLPTKKQKRVIQTSHQIYKKNY